MFTFYKNKKYKIVKMICLCCLKDCTNYFNLFEDESKHLNAIYIISKYLWFIPKEDDCISRIICYECWKYLKEFHQFYIRLEEAHQNYANAKVKSYDQIKEEENETGTNQNFNTFPLEHESFLDHHFADVSNDNDCNEPFKEEEKCKIDEPDEEIEDSLNIEKTKKRKINCKSKSSTTTEIDKKIKKTKNVKKTKCLEKPKHLTAEYNAEIDQKISEFLVMTCDLCSEVAGPKFANLKCHFRKVHNRRNGYAVCCNRRYFKRTFLWDHIKTHIDPNHFKCPKCDRVLASREAIRKHIRIVHEENSKEKRSVECPECHKILADEGILKRHLPLHLPVEEWAFKCEECGKKCPSKLILSSHMKDTHLAKRICQICGKEFAAKKFKAHVDSHASIEETRVQCTVCGTWLKNKKYLYVHMFNHKDAMKKHICSICGKESPNHKALTRHKKNHSGEKKHACTFCDKAFSRPLALKQHVASHTGTPLYSCRHCDQTFFYDSHYHNHRKRDHPLEFEEEKAANQKLRTNFKQLNPKTIQDPGNRTDEILEFNEEKSGSQNLISDLKQNLTSEDSFQEFIPEKIDPQLKYV